MDNRNENCVGKHKTDNVDIMLEPMSRKATY